MNENTNANAADDAAHRARIYGLVALGFDRPDETLIEALRTAEFGAQLIESATAVGDEQLVACAESVARAAPTPAADERSELHATYARLFGFEEGGGISQYELTYRPGTLVTNTNQLADIGGFLEAFDLSLVDGARERLDHLCIELEFVQHLALREAYLVDAGEETGVDVVGDVQRAFVEDHLGRWTARFRDALEDETDDPFYRSLAELLDEFVEREADRLGADPEPFEENPSTPMGSIVGEPDGVSPGCQGCGVGPGGSN